MFARRKFLPLTLVIFAVLNGTQALAVEDVTIKDIKTTEAPKEVPPEGLKEMDISKVPAPKPFTKSEAPVQKNVYFPYQSSISPRLGVGSNSAQFSKNEYYYFYGLQYQFAGENGRHWEVGADVINDGKGLLSLGHKLRLNPTEALRPYFKLGGAVLVDPSEQLTTFLRNENFQVRPATGFEYFLEHPSSLRLEAEAWVSLKKIGFHLSLGYSYAW